MSKEKNIIKPDFLSLTTQQLSIGLSTTNTNFSNATGFLYVFENKVYLITNWHNVSGQNPNTGEHLSNHGGIPDIFTTYLRLKHERGSSLLTKIRLYEDDEMTKPKWLIHPIYREQVDVVAIELVKSPEFAFHAINEGDFEDSIIPEVGDECFILGYPFEDIRYIGLPIWKKASIATEPTVNENQLPKILVDTATRPGLSGSPVIFQRIGIHKMVNGIFNDDTIFGTVRNLLGVYSGRIGKGEFQAQLGIVWKKRVIDEIIKGNLNGDIEFQKGKIKNGL